MRLMPKSAFAWYAPDGKTIMHADLKIGDSVFMLTEESKEIKAFLPNLLVEVQLVCMLTLQMLTPYSIRLYLQALKS